MTSLTVNAGVLVIIEAGLVIFTFILTYLFTYVINHDESYPSYELSVSLNFTPASSIGTLFLCPAAAILVFIAFVRFYQVDLALKTFPQKTQATKQHLVQKLLPSPNVVNKVSFALAVASAIGGHGAVSFQIRENDRTHRAFAGIFFAGSWLYMFATVYLDCFVPDLGKRFPKIIRILLAIADTALLVAMFALWYKSSHRKGGQHRWELFLTALFEILVFACVVSIYFTFVKDFFHLRLKTIVLDDSASADKDLEKQGQNNGER